MTKQEIEQFILDNFETERDRMNLPEYTAHALISSFELGRESRDKEIEQLEQEKDYLCRKLQNMRDIYNQARKV